MTIVNTDETGGTLGSTDDEGDIAMAADSSKNGKRYNVYKVSCSRLVFAEEGSREDNRCKNDNGSEPTGCRRCEPLGFFIFGGATSDAEQPHRLLRIEDLATVGAKGTTIANAGDTVATIDGRFSSANPAYNAATNPHYRSRVGSWCRGRRAIRVVAELRYARGHFLGSGTGCPDARCSWHAGLRRSDLRAAGQHRSFVGVVHGGTDGAVCSILISGGAALTRWNADFTQTGSLRAGCPAACQTIRVDNNTTTAEGTDVGYFAGVDWYPGNRWLGLSATYTFMNFKGVYQPTAALGWPENWTDHNFFFGASFRTPNLIR